MSTAIGGSSCSVRIAVPATSANLGPGFDCLGLALDLRNEFRQGKKWKEADEIRDRLLAMGVEIKDTPAGTTWRKK